MLKLLINCCRTNFLMPLLTHQNCYLFALYIKYVSLSHHQKRFIVAEAERRRLTHEPVSDKALALWAQATFSLLKIPNRVTVTLLLRDLPPPPPETAHRLIYKTVRSRSGQNHLLEVALYQWACDRFSDRMKISHSMIMLKALRLQKMHNARK